MHSSPSLTGAVDILIAEDDELLRSSLRLLLEQAGYTCAEAENGWQAVELARRHPPRCVFLDLAMPGIDGCAVARRLRSDPLTREAHIHFLTGYADEISRRRAREAGGELYLTKPVDVRALLRLVQGQLDRGKGLAGLTKAQAEELLNWLETHGGEGDLLLLEDGFAVRFRSLPHLSKEDDPAESRGAESPLEAAVHEVEARGGWRALFDPYSAEWKWSGLEEKAQLLRSLLQAGCDLGRLVRGFRAHYLERGREDIATAVRWALIELTEHARQKGDTELARLLEDVD